MVFGRKGLDGQSGSHPLNDGFLFPVSSYRHAQLDEEPFGEEILAPESRAMPTAFIGEWADGQGQHAVTIEPRIISYGDDEQRVVAVRQIAAQDPSAYDREIAVVTQSVQGGEVWDFALSYFGLSPDGSRLTDLENMDVVWNRLA